ncbi:MAG: membrane dipeptidase [Acetobacteraceae bacterium]|nr:membrane dipeptidase [Acetobacteraceae bacterium]
MLARFDQVKPHPLAKGWHTQRESPWLFIDGCSQIWPDADFDQLHLHTPTAYLVTSFRPQAGFESAVDSVCDWWRVARTYPTVRLALTARDIEEAKQNRQAAIIIGSQGGDFIGQSLHRLEVMHRLGLRVMIPAYNERNTLCEGVLEPDNAGLSKLGRKWVAECNRLGMLIDLTHTGERSTFEIMDLAQQPLAFTHCNPKKMVNHPRNITDEQMKRCAALGGVVGVTNWGPLNFAPDATTRPTLGMFLDAVAYVADLIGADRVSIGTDMSHGTYPDGDLVRGKLGSITGDRYTQLIDSSPRSRLRAVEGFDDLGQLPDVAEAMMGRGFSKAEVEGILGGNLLRLFRTVWGE